MTLHYETNFLNALSTLIEPTLKIYIRASNIFEGNITTNYNEYHLKQAQYYTTTRYMEVIILCKMLNFAPIVHVLLNLCFPL